MSLVAVTAVKDMSDQAYLVGVVGSGGCSLALLARGELGEVTVVITLPVAHVSSCIQTSVSACNRTYILW